MQRPYPCCVLLQMVKVNCSTHSSPPTALLLPQAGTAPIMAPAGIRYGKGLIEGLHSVVSSQEARRRRLRCIAFTAVRTANK